MRGMVLLAFAGGTINVNVSLPAACYYGFCPPLQLQRNEDLSRNHSMGLVEAKR